MTQRNLLNNNRVFYDPGLNFYITTDLTTNINSSVLTIPVADTSDFLSQGYAILGQPGVPSAFEYIYYSSKTATSLICPAGGRGVKGTLAQGWTAGVYPVSQTRTAPNSIIEEQGDTQFAGWYVTPDTKQASLRVYDSPVILPGVIRFKADPAGGNGLFQGCIQANTAVGVIWQDLNAEKGDTGAPGIINTVLDFVYTGTTNTSNAGLVMKTLSANVASTPFEIRPIISSNITINQVSFPACNIETTSTSIIMEPRAQPYSWDFTASLDTLKGTPSTDALINCYGQTYIYCVEPGYTVSKGQAVIIRPFTNPGVGGTTYLAVQPLIYTNTTELDNYKSAVSGQSLCMVGIAREDADASGETSITPGLKVPVRVCVDGHVPVKISSSVPAGFVVNPAVYYTGRPCLLTRDGFGFNNQTQPVPGTSVLQIGWFMESGVSTSAAGNYIMVKLAPQFITY